MSESKSSHIRTPDQRLRVFVSSTLQEVAAERAAAREAITRLRLAPVMFELGARPHPPKDLYRAYLEQSDIFIGIYWQKYGWVAPDMDISGLEDEWRLSGDKPKLIYLKAPAPDREPRLKDLLDRIRNDDRVSYKPFAAPDELRELIENDLALLLTERFALSRADSAPAAPAAALATETPRHNLPLQLTRFIGREKVIDEVKALTSAQRLVTLIGTGGAGKTRLSLQVAFDLLDTFTDGAWFVELAPINDAALITQTVATAIGLHEEPGQSIGATLTDRLRTRKALLILDNCEHLVQAAAKFADGLLHACSDLHLIASSREGLGVTGEVLYRVPPLAVPDPKNLPQLNEMAQYEAVRLFVDRAASVKPGFALTDQNAEPVAQICARLDGIPLAIELAAARAKTLMPDQIAARLDDRFRLLTGGSRTALPRQQTLRAAIDWSFDLLSAEERTLMQRLSVFAGGWTLESAEAVCAGDGIDDYAVLDLIDSLLNKSMIAADLEHGREARYRMLDTIREYARDRLNETNAAERVRQQHFDFFLKLAEAAEPKLMRGRDQASWLDRLEIDHANFRAALEWSISANHIEQAMQLAAALGSFWNERGYFQEGRQWLEAGINQRERSPKDVQAQTLRAAARLAGRRGDFDRAEVYAQESVALWRELGDRAQLARALNTLAAVRSERGDVAGSVAFNEEVLQISRELNDEWGVAQALSDVGWSAVFMGEYARGTPLLEESLALQRKHQDTFGIAWSALALGVARFLQCEIDQSAALMAESVRLFGALQNQWYVAGCLEVFAGIAGARQQPQRAAQLLGAHDRLVEVMGAKIPVFWDRTIRQPLLAQLNTMIDDATFKTEWNAGHALSFEQAIDFAVQEA
jgi:predicted ATPase